MVSGGLCVARSRYTLGWWDHGAEAAGTSIQPEFVHVSWASQSGAGSQSAVW